MRIFIVRHGETAWNIEGRFQGQIDIPLNNVGKKQALRVAERLKSVRFDAIFTSHLSRAQFTAETIASDSNCTNIIVDDRIIEINHGAWEGCLADEVKTKWGDSLVQWHTTPEVVTMPGVGGESLNDIRKRVTNFIYELKSKYKNSDNILVVSHDAVIKVLLCIMLDMPLSSFWKFQIPNCSISIIELNKDKQPRIALLSDTSHINNNFVQKEQKGL